MLVYWQTQGFDFVNYDDSFYVYENEHVLKGLSLDSVIWAFTTNYQGYWQPLTWLSLIINSHLFGPGAGGFHLINVLLHLVNSLLLFAVLKKMTGSVWKSAFVAVLFTLHPMHVESVAWIAERKDVLSTLFLFLSLYTYTHYVRFASIIDKVKASKTKQNINVFYFLTLLFFLCGLLSKPMLVTLPFLLLLLDLWPLGRFNPVNMNKPLSPKKQKISASQNNVSITNNLIIEKLPFFILSLVSGIITFFSQNAGAAILDTDKIPLIGRIINALASYASYIAKLFWPVRLAVNYPLNFNSIAAISWWQTALFVLLLVGITFLSLVFWKKRKYLSVGWLWFLGTLVPVIGFIQFTGSAYADRFTYIPYIGLFIMIAWGVPELISSWSYKNHALAIGSAVVIALLGILSFQQTSVWKNGVTLFSHATRVTVNNDFAYNNLGSAHEKLGQLEDAVAAYRKAVQINPDFNQAYYNLGNAYSGLKRYEAAVTAYQQAITLQPDFANAYYNLGNAYMNLSATKEAAESFARAIELKNDFVDAYFALGSAYLDLNANQEALEIYLKLIEINPNSEEAYSDMSIAFFSLGRYEEAIGSLKKALEIKPDYIGAHINLGFFYLKAGDKKAALEEYKILKAYGVQQADQLYEMIQEQ